MKMLVLTKKDVEKVLTMKDAFQVVENAYSIYSKNAYHMPPRTFEKVEDENTYMLMPCFAENSLGLKVVSTFPTNREIQEDVTNGVILLNDYKTGKIKALMDGTYVTAVKTGAVSGVTMKYFKPTATSIGVIGTGLQGMYQLLAAVEVLDINNVYLYNREIETAESFVQEISKLIDASIEIEICDSNETLVEKSEVVVTTTTAPVPVISEDSSLYGNKLFIGVGAYKVNMRELPQALFESATHLFIDSEDGKREVGDIIDPIENKWIDEKNVVLISDLLAGKMTVDLNPTEPIIFKTISMSLFDTVFGNHIYHEAVKKGIGKTIEM